MAVTDLISIGVIDADGDLKRANFYVETGETLADLTGYAQAVATLMDAAIAGVIVDMQVTLGIELPGGLRTVAVAGSEVERGALLSYNAAGTEYRHSVFIPTWAVAGFAGNEVVETGVYDAFEQALIDAADTNAIATTDKYGNDLASYIEGKKRFRK